MAEKQDSWTRPAALALVAAALAACIAGSLASCGAEDLEVGGENPTVGPTSTPDEG